MIIDPLYTFVFAGLFSPGPNVIMILASGARFGARATWPHIIGVVIGVGIIAALTGYGIGSLLLAQPHLSFILKCLAALWIVWMAWGQWVSSGLTKSGNTDKPFNVIQAILFQWINPKLWAVAVVASSAYQIGLPPVQDAMRLAIAFSVINLFVCAFWAYFGQGIAKFLSTPKAVKLFRRTMAIILGLSALLVFR